MTLNDVPDAELQPSHAFAGNEFVCETRKTSTVLYGIFSELVRQMYAYNGPDERLFGTPGVVWTPDPQTTGIWIDTELRWEQEHPEFRPAIYVKLGQINYSTVDGSRLGLVDLDVQEAEYHYARVGDGSVSFVHIGSTAGEACALADATLDYLDAFSPVITRDFCFNWFTLASRAPVQQAASDSKERYASTVTYAFRFTDTWTLKLESPKLRGVILKTVDAVARRLNVGDYWDFDPTLRANMSTSPDAQL